MSENNNCRARLVRELKCLSAMPVENRVRPGTPDINYVGGWIECKYMKVWPKGADKNPVRFPHPLLQTQKVWIRKRRMATPESTIFVCALVATEWFFWDGLFAVDHFEKMTRPEMKENALFYMKGFNRERLVDWLISISKG